MTMLDLMTTDKLRRIGKRTTKAIVRAAEFRGEWRGGPWSREAAELAAEWLRAGDRRAGIAGRWEYLAARIENVLAQANAPMARGEKS